MTPLRTALLDGGTTELTADDLTALRARLRGTVLQPGDPGYDDSRSLWNAMIDRRPSLVVRAVGTTDVVETVAFARERGWLMTIKGGGHNIAGLAVNDGALLLDLSGMRGVWVDPQARIAHAQPGSLLGDVDRETQLAGLAAVLGFVSNTGIAGLTLGGGFGYLTRKYGWTSDNVRSMRLVTADGRIVTASESENADLFWGLRGGGGNFGIVTNFEFELHPLGPQIVAGAITWPGERTADILGRLGDLQAQAPPELTLVGAVRLAPPAPWIRKEFHGQPIVALFVCHAGSVEDAERDLSFLRDLGEPVGNIVQRRTYASQQSLLDGTQPKGRRYYWKSEYLPALDPAMLSTLREHVAGIPSGHSGVLLFPVGGALQRHGEDHSAVGNRDAQWVLNIASSWEKPEDDARNVAWTRAAWGDLRAFSTGGTYINFLTEEETGNRIQDAYRGNFERLVRLKGEWDPSNLFRTNKNIPLAPARTG